MVKNSAPYALSRSALLPFLSHFAYRISSWFLLRNHFPCSSFESAAAFWMVRRIWILLLEFISVEKFWFVWWLVFLFLCQELIVDLCFVKCGWVKCQWASSGRRRCWLLIHLSCAFFRLRPARFIAPLGLALFQEFPSDDCHTGEPPIALCFSEVKVYFEGLQASASPVLFDCRRWFFILIFLLW